MFLFSIKSVLDEISQQQKTECGTYNVQSMCHSNTFTATNLSEVVLLLYSKDIFTADRILDDVN